MDLKEQAPISAPEIVLSVIILVAAAIYPNAYVLAGVGALHLGSIGWVVLVPTALVIFGIWLYARSSGMRMLSRGIAVGVLAGILGTFALDAIRIPSTLAGYLPMDEAREIATDLLPAQGQGAMPMNDSSKATSMNDQMTKPIATDKHAMNDAMKMPALTPLQAFLGYLYHYGNGISFALVFVILFGRVRWWAAVLYAVFFVDAGMMIAMPLMMKMGLSAPAWIAALLAHIAYGIVLGLVASRFLTGPGLLALFARTFRNKPASAAVR